MSLKAPLLKLPVDYTQISFKMKRKVREEYRKEFLGNVSHELKTPLFTVQGYIETLLDGAMNDAKIRKNPKRVIFAEGEDENMLKAASTT